MSAAIFTGPITGTVTTNDGTAYDVSADLVTVDDQHAAEVPHLISLRYLASGHLAGYETPPEFAQYAPHPNNEGI